MCSQKLTASSATTLDLAPLGYFSAWIVWSLVHSVSTTADAGFGGAMPAYLSVATSLPESLPPYSACVFMLIETAVGTWNFGRI